MDRARIQTMEELSTAIGVSRPTLSKFFNDPSRVRQSTAEKIRLALERVDYTPNFFATRMNRDSTGIVGVIIPYMQDLFFTSLLEAIEKKGLQHDFTILTQSSHGDPRLESRALERFISMKADAIVISPLGTESDTLALKRASMKLPLVFIDSNLPEPIPGVDFVGTDNQQSVELLMDYLCRTGTPPVFFAKPGGNSNSDEREHAYKERMHQRGLEPRILCEQLSDQSISFEAYAFELLDQYFSRGQYTEDTLLCVNDLLAIGALKAAHRHHLNVSPKAGEKGFRVAGHGDYPLSEFVTPSLTTVSQNVTKLAQVAFDRVLERVDNCNAQPVRRLFKASLKIRESA